MTGPAWLKPHCITEAEAAGSKAVEGQTCKFPYSA